MRPLRWLLVSAVAATFVAACGSSSGDDLFSSSGAGASDSGAPDTSASGGTSGSGGSGALTGGGSGVGGDPASGGGGTGGDVGSGGAPAGGASGDSSDAGGQSGDAGGGGAGGGPATGGGAGAGGSGGSSGGVGGTGGAGTGGAGGQPPGSAVPCGSSPCPTASGGFCCTATSQSGQTTAICNASGSGCTWPLTEAHCDGAEDCAAGQVCCGTFQLISAFAEIYSVLECATSCTRADQRIMCNPAQANACPSGSCQSVFTMPQGYDACR